MLASIFVLLKYVWIISIIAFFVYTIKVHRKLILGLIYIAIFGNQTKRKNNFDIFKRDRCDNVNVDK